MNSQVIAVQNQKGGEGKTTLTLNLAAFMAAIGKRVLVVDMDSQGHISISLALVDDRGRPVEGVFNLLVNEWHIKNCVFEVPADEYEGIAQVPGGSIQLLPGGAKTQLAAVNIQLMGGNFSVLGEALESIKADYDVILIDTAPTRGLWTAGIFQAADFVLIPCQMSRLSLDGAEQIMQQMQVLAGLHSAQVLGLVPMMVQPRTLEYSERLAEAHEMLPGRVWDDVQLSYSTIWKEASDSARTIFSYSKSHKAAKEFWALGNRVAVQLGMGVHDGR